MSSKAILLKSLRSLPIIDDYLVVETDKTKAIVELQFDESFYVILPTQRRSYKRLSSLFKFLCEGQIHKISNHETTIYQK